MSDDYYDDRDDLHADCVSTDDVLSYALENHWHDLEDTIAESQSEDWLSESKPCIELLSTISQRDHTLMRGTLKERLLKKAPAGDNVTEEQLFSIAADVSAYLEQLPASFRLPPVVLPIGPHGYQGTNEPTAARCILFSSRKCVLGDDLSWAKDLLVITRAFRNFLAIVSEPEEPQRLRLREPIEIFNLFLRKNPAQLLVYWEGIDKQLRFGRCPEPESSDLSSFIANWISEYLRNHFCHVGLGVCAECGKFFPRERRDKTFCSKTCQNRVAYKRKKILESNALVQVDIPPDDACDIAPGLWIHHPRYGIGLVESVSSESKPVSELLAKVSGNPDTMLRYRSMLSRKLRLHAQFLQGIRTLGYADLFEGQKKEEQLPTFYQVKSEETLAELL